MSNFGSQEYQIPKSKKLWNLKPLIYDDPVKHWYLVVLPGNIWHHCKHTIGF